MERNNKCTLNGKQLFNLIKDFIIENDCTLRIPIEYIRRYEYCAARRYSYPEKEREEVALFWKTIGDAHFDVNTTEEEMKKWRTPIEKN